MGAARVVKLAMKLINNFSYRPEIDGLRAVAVIAVLLFHGGFGCPGGYVGVDVFFVISGFLITSLIWKDLENGSFSFAHFWERRARRIVPALVGVTLATLVGGWFLLLPPDFKTLGQASAAQSLFLANVHYWRDSNYFAAAAVEKPLLHTWSLAVEEQFYLLVPLLLWSIFRAVRLRNRTALISLLGTGFTVSFVLSVYALSRSPAFTFYLLPTRAWELLLGSLLAFAPLHSAWSNRRGWREGVALLGLLLILVPVFRYNAETPFPGLAALPPCLGTALIIWANGRDDKTMPTLTGTVLAWKPVVFIGLISYSLYLWHWPFLAFSHYLAVVPPSPPERAGLLALGLVCAILSWKYVETPFRVRKLAASRPAMFRYAGAGLAAIFVWGLLCLQQQGFPQRFSPQVQKFAAAELDMGLTDELTLSDVRADKLIRIGVANPALRPQVLVWGDSHAMSALPAVDALLKEKGMAGRAATHSVTAPVLDWFFPSEHGLDKASLPYNDAVFSVIEKQKITDVILVAFWTKYTAPGGSQTAAFEAALVKTTQRLVAINVQPWILLDVPLQPFSVPRVLARSAASRTEITQLCATPSSQDQNDLFKPETLAAIRAAGGRVLNPKPAFLDATGHYYKIQANNTALYRDGQHLTPEGARLMLLPFLRTAMTLGKEAS